MCSETNLVDGVSKRSQHYVKAISLSLTEHSAAKKSAANEAQELQKQRDTLVRAIGVVDLNDEGLKNVTNWKLVA